MKKYTIYFYLFINIWMNFLHTVKTNGDKITPNQLLPYFEIDLTTDVSNTKISSLDFVNIESSASSVDLDIEFTTQLNTNTIPNLSESITLFDTSKQSSQENNDSTTEIQYISEKSIKEDKSSTKELFFDKNDSIKSKNGPRSSKNTKDTVLPLLFVPKKISKENNLINTPSRNFEVQKLDISQQENRKTETISLSYDQNLSNIQMPSASFSFLTSKLQPLKKNIKILKPSKHAEFKEYLSIDGTGINVEKLNQKEQNQNKKDDIFFPDSKLNKDHNSINGNSLLIDKHLEPSVDLGPEALDSADGLDPLLAHEENDLFTRWSSEEQEIEMEKSIGTSGMQSNSYEITQRNYLLQLRGNTTIVGIRPRDFTKYLKLNLAARLSLEYDQVKVVGVHVVPASQTPWIMRDHINQSQSDNTNIILKNELLLKENNKMPSENADRIEVNLTLYLNQQNANYDLNALTKTTLLELSGQEYIIEGLLPTKINLKPPDSAASVRVVRGPSFASLVGVIFAALIAAGIFITVCRFYNLRSRNCPEASAPENSSKASVIYKGFYGQEPYIYTEIDPPGTPRQMKLNIFTCRPGSILVPSKRGTSGNVLMKASNTFYETHMQSHLLNCLE